MGRESGGDNGRTRHQEIHTRGSGRNSGREDGETKRGRIEREKVGEVGEV